jgi:predicted AAA+ superfamily ATPase
MTQNRIIERVLKIDLPANRSAFLWGPRKTGKTTLLRQQFSEACWIDLLDFDLFLRLSQKPTQLRQILEA